MQTAPTHPNAAPPRQAMPRHKRRMLLMRVLAGVVLATLSACTDFPAPVQDLTEADRQAGFPALVPVEDLLRGTEAVAIQPRTQATLENRVAALDRRAAALRATGLDAQTRARMQAGVATDAVTPAP